MLAELMARWRAEPIANCPGRFVLKGVSADAAPDALLGGAHEIHEWRVAAARDAVLTSWFGDGGLISYRRANGTYLHTLNTADGFRRKLAQLGIDFAG